MASSSGSGAGGSGGGDDDIHWRIKEQMRAVTSREINRVIQAALQQQPAVPRPIHHRAIIPQDHIVARHRLYEDYFTPEPRFGENMYRRHFRMHRPLFLRTVDALERRYEYFRMREDAVGKPDHTSSPLSLSFLCDPISPC